MRDRSSQDLGNRPPRKLAALLISSYAFIACLATKGRPQDTAADSSSDSAPCIEAFSAALRAFPRQQTLFSSLQKPAMASAGKECASARAQPRRSYRALALLALASAASAQTFTNQTSMSGTWSSGSYGVETGPGFFSPVNMTFALPNNTGISYSFTDDGYFEEAQYRFVSNGTSPRCVKAVLIYQHGTYKFQPNGSITTSPWAQDGRIQVEDPCAAETSLQTYYNEPGLFQSWSISIDTNHNAWMLQLAAFDGSLLPRLYLRFSPPQMNPTQIFSSNGSTTAAGGQPKTIAKRWRSFFG